MDKGAKYRFQLSGKQLENVAPEVKQLIQGLKKPVVNVGINGRGAEGSMYGIKVFENGSKKPVAALAGRIDYREPNPILQARGYVNNLSGEGDAVRGNVMLNTNKAINIENMDEFSLSKKGNGMAVTADSNWLKADVKGDKGVVQEILAKLGFASNMTSGRAKMAQNMSEVKEGLIEGLKKLNPLSPKASVDNSIAAVPQVIRHGNAAAVVDLPSKAVKDKVGKTFNEILTPKVSVGDLKIDAKFIDKEISDLSGSGKVSAEAVKRIDELSREGARNKGISEKQFLEYQSKLDDLYYEIPVANATTKASNGVSDYIKSLYK